MNFSTIPDINLISNSRVNLILKLVIFQYLIISLMLISHFFYVYCPWRICRVNYFVLSESFQEIPNSLKYSRLHYYFSPNHSDAPTIPDYLGWLTETGIYHCQVLTVVFFFSFVVNSNLFDKSIIIP